MSAFEVDRTLVALNATFDRNVNSHCRTLALETTVDSNAISHCSQNFGSSKYYDFQLRQFMGTTASSRC